MEGGIVTHGLDGIMNEESKQPVQSAMMIKFLAPNDIRFDVEYLGHVHPLQVIAVCEFLITQQKSNLLNAIAEEADKEGPMIATPDTVFYPQQ